MTAANNIRVFYNVRLLDESTDGQGALLVTNGKIRAVFMGLFTNQRTVAAAVEAILLEDGYADKNVEYVDGRGMALSPAFIDLHTHLRYPGQEQKEDLSSALLAAAAGGYCTVVAMPNTKPVVSSAAQAAEVVEEAAKVSPVKVIQSVSITRNFSEQDTTHLSDIDAKTVPIITQDGKDVENTAVMLDAMCRAARKGIIVSCHCEDTYLSQTASPLREEAIKVMAKNGMGPCGTDDFIADFPKGDDTYDEDSDDDDDERYYGTGGGNLALEYSAGSEEDGEEGSRNEANDLLAAIDTMLSLAETTAVMRNIALSQTAMCHVHIAHISTAQAMDAVRNAKSAINEAKEEGASAMAETAWDAVLSRGSFIDRGEEEEGFEPLPDSTEWNVTCEVTPHHLALCGNAEPFNRAIVNPPLGTEEDRLAVLEGIRDGTVDAIATDHAPHTAADKAAGAPGFVGLETAYAVCNTVLCAGEKDDLRHGQITESRLSQLMSANPARILHLNKGRLASGYDADLVLLDSDEVWKVDSKHFHSKGRATPFDGMEVVGKVKALYIGGIKVGM